MILKSLVKLAILCSFACTSPAVLAYETQFGPFFGQGVTSMSGQVSYHNGYFLSLRHDFATPFMDISLAPLLEFSNAFTSIEHTQDQSKQNILYDHRIFAGGFQLNVPIGHSKTMVQSLYLTFLRGKAYSKANMDESTTQSFQQSFFQKIDGDYWAGQIGVHIPIKGSLALDLAYLNALQLFDQSKDAGEFDREYLEGGQKYTLSDSYSANNRPIPNAATIRTYAVKLGLSVGF